MTGAAWAQSISQRHPHHRLRVSRHVAFGRGCGHQGSFDYSTDLFYAGVWAQARLAATDGELDVYAVSTPTLGPALISALSDIFIRARMMISRNLISLSSSSAARMTTESFTIGASPATRPRTWRNRRSDLCGNHGAAIPMFAASAAFGSYRIDDLNGPPRAPERHVQFLCRATYAARLSSICHTTISALAMAVGWGSSPRRWWISIVLSISRALCAADAAVCRRARVPAAPARAAEINNPPRAVFGRPRLAFASKAGHSVSQQPA